MAGKGVMVGNPQRRVERISALAADIAARQREVMKLLAHTVRVFYTCFMLACLTIGVAAFIRGNVSTAAAWGGTGLVLGFFWILVYVGDKVSRRAVRTLREELTAHDADEELTAHDADEEPRVSRSPDDKSP